MTVVARASGINLRTEIIEAARARRSAILAGPNTSDLFLGPQGSFVYLPELVAQLHAADGRTPVNWSASGMVPDPVPGQSTPALRLPPADTPPGQAFRELREQLRASRQSVVVVADFLDLRLPAALAGTQLTPDQQLLIETLVGFPTDPALSAHRVVVISRTDGLDQRLARFPGWEVVNVDFPDEQLRVRFTQRLLHRHGENPGAATPLDPGLSPEIFGRDCGGLTLDDMMRGSAEATERGEPLGRRWVHRTKVRRLRQRCVEGLDVYPPGEGMASVAGLAQIRLLLQERRLIGSPPRSIVLTGPPGVGKTLVVRAIADEYGWPAVSLGNLRSMWQGETEARTRAVLSTAQAMAPLVFHIDEVDQALGQRDTGPSVDGGTGARLLAEFWSFLSDSNPDLPVMFVLTSNRADLLDPATLSRSEIIPILHPTPSEQVGMLRIACEQLNLPISEEAARVVIAGTGLNIVSGRMLVRVAQRAAIVAAVAGESTLTEQHLKTAFGELLERTNPLDDERMALTALALASFTSYLPWVAAERLGEPVELLPYVAPLLEADGSLNRERLEARIGELDEAAARRQVRRSA